MKAAERLNKDRDALLTFYDHPGIWKHLRTTNLIERTFATMRERTIRSRGACPKIGDSSRTYVKGCMLISESQNTTRLSRFVVLGYQLSEWSRTSGGPEYPQLVYSERSVLAH